MTVMHSAALRSIAKETLHCLAIFLMHVYTVQANQHLKSISSHNMKRLALSSFIKRFLNNTEPEALLKIYFYNNILDQISLLLLLGDMGAERYKWIGINLQSCLMTLLTLNSAGVFRRTKSPQPRTMGMN